MILETRQPVKAALLDEELRAALPGVTIRVETDREGRVRITVPDGSEAQVKAVLLAHDPTQPSANEREKPVEPPVDPAPALTPEIVAAAFPDPAQQAILLALLTRLPDPGGKLP